MAESKVDTEEDPVPATMAATLDFENPPEALDLIANLAQRLAQEKAVELTKQIRDFQIKLPDVVLSFKPDTQNSIVAAMACADSIDHSLTKIASGGSQASQEIRKLEEEKRSLESHARAVERALLFRQNSQKAMQAMQTQQLKVAAEAIGPWLEWKNHYDELLSSTENGDEEDDNNNKNHENSTILRQEYEDSRAYAGEYCLKQLASTHGQLREVLLQKYEQAVQTTDLAKLGELTPILSLVQLEKDAVRLYLQFLRQLLQKALQQAQVQPPPKGKTTTPPFVALGRVYNAAVSCLRHHLPMVSHFLYKADGDIALIQLVHVEVEEVVLPILQQYRKDRQLAVVSRNAQQVYAALEERFTGRAVVDESENDDEDDCGFSVSIGSLADADAAMEEAAMCIQHTESYIRFVQHSCEEVNKARKIRFTNEQKQKFVEANGRNGLETEIDAVYTKIEILPGSTPLYLAVVELGGQYAGIERCLLLASIQRAFFSISESDSKYFRPLALPSVSSSRGAPQKLQTSVVDSCFYAARHAAQRAFATGHTGTASAMTNFCVDCLTGVLTEVLSERARESGVARLKPGEGLLVGSAGLFNNASNLIRQGTNVSSVVTQSHGRDEGLRKQRLERELAHACAMINDLEVAIHHSQQLEGLLNDSVNQGFPQDHHETDTLRMCVKSLSSVTEGLKAASDSVAESLESSLKSRLRSIVSEAVGNEGSTFMGTSVMGGNKTTDRVMVRMNYDLDEEAYNLSQVSEGYVARLTTLTDELLTPLQQYLAPRVWDTLLIEVLGTIAKRLETSIRKCHFTALGSLQLDSDVRDVLNYAKGRFISPDYSSSNVAVTRACPALSRLLQIAKLISVDDLDDVLDLIRSSRQKGNWDLKLDDAKTLLCLRREFEDSRVNELLQISDD